MPSKEGQSKGGQVMAERQKRESLERYYENPNFCAFCGEMIMVHENEKPSETRRRKYCNSSCAAKANNRGVNRHHKIKGKK